MVFKTLLAEHETGTGNLFKGLSNFNSVRV
jgi:hypothetical protein